ncbi:similar to Saccharomyces cerevisiae YOR109W INP53 Polyphosphatidylinositol phosphatase, dephosphorylates multiple phosphatidylinositols [Maudiozyma saulgeensis]|uniref:phosphoinositide 5-phosphatase n=1 Tax=Maudiozyma saulgeensis TaxID=1789683 RepID=A0A1X7QYZ6_9SACH|nr:similar to Saccharomyces cerevisiae YOR109W INP53 Polyphosphatidylinositol phosphatase, dephosphorylates multiple phosphatidylinositols [Kazachstania saulgeensis]
MLILLSTERRERKLAIVSESYALLFTPVKDNISKKSSCAIELIPKEELQHHRFRKLSPHDVHGFIGLLEIDGLIFIGVITGKTKVASPIPQEVINKIYAIDFFCLNDNTWDFIELDPSGKPIAGDLNDLHEQQLSRHPCYDVRKLMSNGSFYYSNDFDLTSTLQNRGFKNEESVNDDTMEEEYMWNSFLMEEVLAYRDRLDSHTKHILDNERFLTTVIRGFAETFVTYIKRLKIGLTVISKQSWKRAGTRFNARGIDDDGNVANFVETELIMYSNEYCYAFTQVRGSVPIFWEQDAALMNAKVTITRSIEATQPVFDEHFAKLISKYGPVNIINLLSTKSNEIELSRRYRSHLQKSDKLGFNKNIFLTEFDFHRETAQDGFNAAKKILPLIKDALLTEGYYCYDVQEDQIVSEQNGIFRTNCLDCLDRTNLVQQLMSYELFKTFLHDVELITPRANVDESDFIKKHNALWADQGDQISQIYTGTNALKSSYSRKGKMSFSGALSDAKKSVSRMYINNFMDKGKQQNIDALLGRLPNQKPVRLYDPIGDYINEELSKMSDQYTTTSNMNLLIGTYNVNGMSKRADLSKWLFPIGDKFKPDIVVLGLQEVIEMSASAILNADNTKGSFWEYVVKDCLNQYDDQYILLRVEQMTSLVILFFVKSDKVKNVKRVEGSTKKTGFGGMTGNKGAVAIRFEYGSTSFCFVNAHFSAGNSNVDERANDYVSINKNISFARSRKILDNDSVFWFGDLNYRISLPNEVVRKELELEREGYIDRLLKHDQLTQEIDSGIIFHDYCEPTLQFRPTYKFDFGTNIYDSSEKRRTPSWTDRIVYKGDNLHPLAYSSAPLTISDHRPVYAAYRTDVSIIDEEKKHELSNKLYENFKLKEDSNAVASSLSTDDDNEDIELEAYLEPNHTDSISARKSPSKNIAPPVPSTSHSSSSTSLISLTKREPRSIPNVPKRESSSTSIAPVPPMSRSRQSNSRDNASQREDSNSDQEKNITIVPKSQPNLDNGERTQIVISRPPSVKPRKQGLRESHEEDNTSTNLPESSERKKKTPPIVPNKKEKLENIQIEGLTKKVPPIVPKKKAGLGKLHGGSPEATKQ